MYFCYMQESLKYIINLLRKSLSTIDIKVYAICVFIASFIWLLMTLSDNYTEEIEFPVSYNNYPKGMILVNKPSNNITVQVEAQGFELAKNSLSNKDNVKIDLSKIHLHKSKYGRYIASIPTSTFRYNIINQLNVNNVGKKFKPDSIYFIFDSLATKQLPVRLNSKITFAKGYTQYGNAIIYPNTVEAKGPSLTLQKINFVITDSLLAENVKEDINKELRLKEVDNLVKLSTNKVAVRIHTEKYSEFSFLVPVKVKSNIPNLKVKTFPSKVKLTCSMALPDYKKLSDTSFQVIAVLDSIDLLNENKIILQLAKKPKNVKSLSLSDESVEFVIIH